MLFFGFVVVLIIPYVVLLIYYFMAWNDIEETGFPSAGESRFPFFSVIIAARNEEGNIRECLESMTNQHYPPDRFEIWVVNDFSEDGTAEVVLSFQNHFHNVRLINLSDFLKGDHLNSYKKKAIEAGISQSRGEWIVTTDADCMAGTEWLRTMAGCVISENPSMIAAPVRFMTSPAKNIFQKLFFFFQALDFMTLQGITGAALSKHMHYMANGANLAYRKKTFEEVGGFSGIDGIASGDDMLLMEKFGFERKIFFLKNKDAIVSTMPEKTLKGFFNQRIRWAGKSASYRDVKIKWVLAMVYAINACLLVLALSALFIQGLWIYLLVFFLLKVVSEILFLWPVSGFFGQRKLLRAFVFFQPFHAIYILVAGWLGAFGSYQWKGRRVK